MTIEEMKDYFSHRELGLQEAAGEYAILVPLVQWEGQRCLLIPMEEGESARVNGLPIE